MRRWLEKLRAKRAAKNGPLVLDRTEVPTGGCQLCGKHDELRPYGANGEWICFDCGMKDEATTSKRFNQVVFGDGHDA